MNQRSNVVAVCAALLFASSMFASACSDDPVYPYFFGDADNDGSGGGSDAGDTGGDVGSDTGGDTGGDASDSGDDVDPSCEAGESRCQGAGVAVCVEGSWVASDCPEGTECLVEGGVASCVSSSCEPFSLGCFDSSTAWECNEDGTSRTAIPCATGATCQGGSCVAMEECLSVSPTVIEFGEVELGSGSTRSVQLSSCAAGPVTVVNVESTSDAFVVSAPSTPFSVSDAVVIDVMFAPVAAGEYFEELYVETAGGDLYAVDLSGFSASSDCPVARGGCRVAGSGSYTTTVNVPVGSEVECADTGSSGPLEITDWFWGMETVPFGSVADIINDGDFAYFQADAVGLYTVTFSVQDDGGTPSCNTQRINVTARDPDSVMPDMHVQLVWDDGADLDNHLLRGTAVRGNIPGDCHYGNMTPDWGATGALNNPRLDVDDTDGLGPENINLGVVEAGIDYTALAFVTSLEDASTRATLRLYVGGELVREFTKSLDTDSQVWTAFKIRFAPDGSHTLTVIDTLTVAP